ncbi:MAG: S8 family serine peptidase, partial [Casimicrobiaceae bacterium]
MNRFVRWAAVRLSFDRAASGRISPQRSRRFRFSLALPLLLAAAGVVAQDLAPSAITQIQQIGVEKLSRTPAQKKIDSQLLYAARVAAGSAAAIYGALPQVPSIAPDANGRVKVDIRAAVDSGTLALVTSAGGIVTGSYPGSNSIQASVPLDKLEQIAADPRVISVRRPAIPATSRAVKVTTAGADGAPQQPLSPRLQRFQKTVKTALAAFNDEKNCCGAGVIPKIGARESQGDAAHRANNARAAFNVNGAGIRIGVLSDSFDNLGGASADIASGDLPGPGNPNGFLTPVGFAGSGDCAAPCGADEGRAMLQIVHDLAPGAILFFATAFNNDADFANNIRALGGLSVTAPPFGTLAPGCDIIIDDVSYSNESGLHDGQNVPSDANLAMITQAVNDVAAAGVLYFSSAANSGNVVDGTSGAWEGDYSAGTTPAVIGYGTALKWNGTAVGNPLTASAPYVDMQWSDPINGACNDYDFFLLNAGMSGVTAFSTNTQDCTNDPFEELYTGATFPVGANLVVVLAAADPMIVGSTSLPRFISITTNRGQIQYNTNGATRGHNAAASGFSIAATPAAQAFGPPTPNGPFPGPFVASNEIEEFSSDGPRRAFFNPDLSAVTPGNFLAATNGGIVRQKPDFTAADGVDTTLPPATGLNPFYGTSAAAPHAGAIAALVKQAAPAATPAQIRTFLTSTSLDIMAAGVDDASGAGILQAFQAVQATGITGIATLDAGTITVTRTPAPGPILPGDSATVIVQLMNNGAATATGISATLTTSTPCITIGTATSAYPDIAIGANATNTTPFAFSLSNACLCPQQIDFTLMVTFTGGSSTVTFSVVTGPPPAVINAQLDGTAPTGLPAGYTFVSGNQTARLGRDGVIGACGPAKAFPGPFGSGTRRYEAYSFTTPNTAPNFCVTVNVASAGQLLFSGGYLGAYDPNNLGTNYVSDPGSSSTSESYSFTAPANQLVTIIVNEVNSSAVPIPYTITIGGLCGVVVPVDVGVTAFNPGASVVPGTNASYTYTVTETSPSSAPAANV